MSRSGKSIVEANFDTIPIANYKLAIPRRTAKLLYLSKEKPQDMPFRFGIGISISINLFNNQIEINDLSPDEPSTIYVKLPIKKPDNIKSIPRPDYYPTYAELTPEKRWIYLNWLRNLSEPIDIGYVFLYYYGLERHLLLGDFDLAFDEILYLRKYHHNSSFVSYSNSALLHSCIFRKRPDRLKDALQLLEPGNFGNIHLLIAHHLGFDLTAKNLIDISKDIRDINRRYINNNPDLFECILNERLTAKYGSNYFPFSSRYIIEDLPKVQDILFANFSFPSEIRTPDIPNFFEYQPFLNELRSLFEETHEEVKITLREQRKRKR